jgi:MarR family transcriptional regulator, lower aerobic nicotinate degradation pathway regulator
VPPLKRVADRPTWLLSRAAARAQTLLADAFTAEGVRGYHYRVLAALDQYGPSSQADLGRNTGIDRSDVVATVNALVASGLGRRTHDPVDARRNVVTITTRGTTKLARLDAAVDAVQDTLLTPLTATERRTLARLLRKLT